MIKDNYLTMKNGLLKFFTVLGISATLLNLYGCSNIDYKTPVKNEIEKEEDSKSDIYDLVKLLSFEFESDTYFLNKNEFSYAINEFSESEKILDILSDSTNNRWPNLNRKEDVKKKFNDYTDGKVSNGEFQEFHHIDRGHSVMVMGKTPYCNPFGTLEAYITNTPNEPKSLVFSVNNYKAEEGIMGTSTQKQKLKELFRRAVFEYASLHTEKYDRRISNMKDMKNLDY